MADKTKGLDLTELTKLLSASVKELAWAHDYDTCKGLSKIIATSFQDHSTGIGPELSPAPVTRFYFSTTSPLSYIVFKQWDELARITDKYRYSEEIPSNESWQRKDVFWYPLDKLQITPETWISFYCQSNTATALSSFYIIREGGEGVAKIALVYSMPMLKEILRNFSQCLESGTGNKALFAILDVIDEIWTMANVTLLEPTGLPEQKAAAR